MSITPVAKSGAGAAAPVGPLSVRLGCPQCGGPSDVADDVVSVHCPHCASLLVVVRPGREQFFLADGQIRDSQDIRRTVILYRVQSHRADLLARFGLEPRDDQPPPLFPEPLIERLLAEFESRLEERLRVREAHRLHVPYWHLSGLIVQAILGRRHSGPKEMRVRGFLVEHTVAAYDAARANLRDRGLRLSRTHVRPLTRIEVAEAAPFVPWQPIADRTYQEIRKWQGRDLDPDNDPVAKFGAFLFARRVLVYRPYWLAWVESDEEARWILLDGAFETIAGYPDADEVDSLRRLGVGDPEGRESRETHVRIQPSRCPDCGFDQRFGPTEQIHVCPNCHLALQPTPNGINVVRYDHAASVLKASAAPSSPPAAIVDLDATYLPFWSYEFSLTTTDGHTLTRLEDYASLLFPQQLPPGVALRGGRLWFPAFRLLGTEPGDEVFKALAEYMHAASPELRSGKVPLGGRPSFVAVTVPEEEAREGVRYLLYALHGRTAAARLNTLLLKRTVEATSLVIGTACLVMIPADRASEEDVGCGRVVISRLLIDGGPKLDALRATVYQARPEPEGTS